MRRLRLSTPLSLGKTAIVTGTRDLLVRATRARRQVGESEKKGSVWRASGARRRMAVLKPRRILRWRRRTPLDSLRYPVRICRPKGKAVMGVCTKRAPMSLATVAANTNTHPSPTETGRAATSDSDLNFLRRELPAPRKVPAV